MLSAPCFVFFSLVPLLHTGLHLTEGPHQSSDPWGPGRSMTQPGYSAMVGNSPHLNQHGPFTAINPQDRLVSDHHPCLHVQISPIGFKTWLIDLEFQIYFLCKHEIKGSDHDVCINALSGFVPCVLFSSPLPSVNIFTFCFKPELVLLTSRHLLRLTEN